ncbi:MAG: protein-glutamate O-methyltransferase CheR [Deltaproteobacteria bacterium]|nr:protein-glutamate O-methyltransferase CheR [Deltaproteobacteria bacterium]
MTGYRLTDKEFENFRRLVYDKCGINLHLGKKELVQARLGKRMRAGNFTSFRDYYNYVVDDPSGNELTHLLDAISTNQTHFFREPQHFQFLCETALPEVLKANGGKRARTIRLWSAGCSTGEEPYSMAISLLEALPARNACNIRILATDLSTKVLATASSGVYDVKKVEGVPQHYLRKYFQKGCGRWQGYVRIKKEVARLIEFKRVNFMEPFCFNQHFDVIFCRNVMIYFDKTFQEKLVDKFHTLLNPGGYLMIGHSESLTGVNHRFKYIRPTIYRKQIS